MDIIESGLVRPAAGSFGPTVAPDAGAEKVSTDCLLWVGESGHKYRWFNCEKSQSCAIPYLPLRDDHCFVHEAERRGVSRKISPPLPGWLKPGKTRVFLAHHAGEKSNSRGKIFGYFTVERVDFIDEAPESYDGNTRVAGTKPAPSMKRKQPARAGRRNAAIIKKITKLSGQMRGAARSPTVTRRDDEKASDDRSCGRTVVWQHDREDIDDPSCAKSTTRPHDDEYADNGPYSKRIIPGAIYLVDALCAQIDDAWASYRRQAPDAGPEEFNELVDCILGIEAGSRITTSNGPTRVPLAKIPHELGGLVSVRGEMVLFNSPLPVFEAQPHASFRNISHIDGDHLLEQIVDKVMTPEIRHCVPATKRDSLSKEEIATLLAEQCHLTMTAGRDIQSGIASLADAEIERCGGFRFPNLGTIRKSAPLNKPLTKAQVIAELASTTGLSRSRCKDVVDTLFHVAVEELKRCGRFAIFDLATFELRDRNLDFIPRKRLADRGLSFRPNKKFLESFAGGPKQSYKG